MNRSEELVQRVLDGESPQDVLDLTLEVVLKGDKSDLIFLATAMGGLATLLSDPARLLKDIAKQKKDVRTYADAVKSHTPISPHLKHVAALEALEKRLIGEFSALAKDFKASSDSLYRDYKRFKSK